MCGAGLCHWIRQHIIACRRIGLLCARHKASDAKGTKWAPETKKPCNPQLTQALMVSCNLTTRSSRRCFVASLAGRLKPNPPLSHCAPRLNSGVRAHNAASPSPTYLHPGLPGPFSGRVVGEGRTVRRDCHALDNRLAELKDFSRIRDTLRAMVKELVPGFSLSDP